jgi:hypothetical protein
VIGYFTCPESYRTAEICAAINLKALRAKFARSFNDRTEAL